MLGLLYNLGRLIGRGRKSQISQEFRGSFRGKLHQKDLFFKANLARN